MKFRSPISFSSDEKSALARVLHSLGDLIDDDDNDNDDNAGFIRVEGTVMNLDRRSKRQLAELSASDAEIESVANSPEELADPSEQTAGKLLSAEFETNSDQRASEVGTDRDPAGRRTEPSAQPSGDVKSTHSDTDSEARSGDVTIPEPPLFHDRDSGEMSVRISNELLDDTPLKQFNRFNVGIDLDRDALAFCAPTRTDMGDYEPVGQISIERFDGNTKIPVPEEAGIFEPGDRPEELRITDGLVELSRLDPDEIEDLETRLDKSAPSVSTDDGITELDSSTPGDQPAESAESSPSEPAQEIDYPVTELVETIRARSRNDGFDVRLPDEIVQASRLERGEFVQSCSYINGEGRQLSRSVEGYGEFTLDEYPIDCREAGTGPADYSQLNNIKLKNTISLPKSYTFELGEQLLLMVDESRNIKIRPAEWDAELEAEWQAYVDEQRGKITQPEGIVDKHETGNEQGDLPEQKGDLELAYTVEAVKDTNKYSNIAIPVPEEVRENAASNTDESMSGYTEMDESYNRSELTDLPEYGEFSIADYPLMFCPPSTDPRGKQYIAYSTLQNGLALPNSYSMDAGQRVVVGIDDDGHIHIMDAES